MLGYGWIAGRLSPAQMATMLVLWIAGYVGLARVPYMPALGAFPTYFATLDVVLLLMFACGGVRLKQSPARSPPSHCNPQDYTRARGLAGDCGVHRTHGVLGPARLRVGRPCPDAGAH